MLPLAKSVTNSPQEPIAGAKLHRGGFCSPLRPLLGTGGGKEGPNHRGTFGTKLEVRWVFLSLELHCRI